MAITFLKQRQRQKYLILVFVFIVFLILIVIGRGVLLKKGKTVLAPPTPLPPPKVEINYEALKSPILRDLEDFEEIKPFEGEIGRDNPFLPY